MMTRMFYTIKDLQEMTSLTYNFLRKSAETGKLQGAQLTKGGSWVFSKEAVEKFLQTFNRISSAEPKVHLSFKISISLSDRIDTAVACHYKTITKQQFILNAIDDYIKDQKPQELF